MVNEIYRLTLSHYIASGEERVRIDEPLVVQMIIDRQYTPTPVCLNRMLDMMRNEVLRRAGEDDGK